MTFDPRWNRSIVVTGININSAGTDTSLVFPLPIGKYRPTKLTIFDASTSLAASLATLGLFTAASGGGSTLVTAATLTSLTGATACVDMTLLLTTTYQTSGTLFLRNVVAHGSAATVSACLSYDWLG